MAFAASLGEFGAVITFAGNVPGATQTLPLALYSALDSPDGDKAALRLALIAIALGVSGLALAEFAGRRLARALGR
jgi:molybdate transport system permease protein